MLFGCHINIVIRLCLIEKALEINSQRLFQTKRILWRNPSAVCNEIIDSLVRNSGTQCQFALRKMLLCSDSIENSTKRNVMIFQILVVHRQCFSVAKLINNNQIWLQYLSNFKMPIPTKPTSQFSIITKIGNTTPYFSVKSGVVLRILQVQSGCNKLIK